MKLVKQKHKDGCGPACLAIVLGITYDKALNLTHPNRKFRGPCGTVIEEMSLVLDKCNIKYDITRPNKLPRYKNNSAIIMVVWNWKLTKGEWKGELASHWIVWNHEKQKYLSPSKNHSITTYKNSFVRKANYTSRFVIKIL